MKDIMDSLFQYLDDTLVPYYLESDPYYRTLSVQAEQRSTELETNLPPEKQTLLYQLRQVLFDEQLCLQRATFQAAMALCAQLNRTLFLLPSNFAILSSKEPHR